MGRREEVMAAVDLRRKPSISNVHRGSQVIFGEREHLLEILRSVERAKLPGSRKQAELRQLRKLIEVRTEELNRLSPVWDRKFKRARDPRTSSRELRRLATWLATDDHLLARALTEHPQAPPELLESLARHPYAAVRENVARHPHTPPAILRQMAEDGTEPLWFLVAFNPVTPQDLRDRLRTRIREGAYIPP